jgi:uncharacterized coiled-coil protein SlyX
MSAPLRPSYESELEARIAELEAEVDALRDVLTETRDGANNLWAERDRLKAALNEIANLPDIGPSPAVRIARAALSGEGVTK